jgi:SET domain-containing protein
MCYSNVLYIDNSDIEGSGLFSKKNINKGECVGLLARVYGDDMFDDQPYGRYINHADESNLDLKIVRDKLNKIIYVLGIANKYITKGEELTANYLDKYAPKPNFKTDKSYKFKKKLNI